MEYKIGADFWTRGLSAIGRGNKRHMSQHHRVVSKEGFVPILLNKIANIISADFWTKCILIIKGGHRAIDTELRLPVALTSFFHPPQTMFIKACIHWKRSFPRKLGCECPLSVKLPLTGDTGGVTSIFHHVTKGFFFRIKHIPVHIISNVGFTGHDFDSTGATKWLGVTVIESQACFC